MHTVDIKYNPSYVQLLNGKPSISKWWDVQTSFLLCSKTQILTIFFLKFKFHCQQQTKLLAHIQDVFSASVTMPYTEPLSHRRIRVWLWMQHDANFQGDAGPINAVNSSPMWNHVTGNTHVEREHPIKWIESTEALVATSLFSPHLPVQSTSGESNAIYICRNIPRGKTADNADGLTICSANEEVQVVQFRWTDQRVGRINTGQIIFKCIWKWGRLLGRHFVQTA